MLARYRTAFDGVLSRLVSIGGTKVLQYDTAQLTPDAISEALLRVLVADRPPRASAPPARAP